MKHLTYILIVGFCVLVTATLKAQSTSADEQTPVSQELDVVDEDTMSLSIDGSDSASVIIPDSVLLDVPRLKQIADSLYSVEQYAQAIFFYKEVLQHGQSADICYNLGNCYYRMDEIANCILWYERASLLSPNDEDIRFNLNMARSKTIDRVLPRHEFFFVTWFRSLTNWMAADGWGQLAVVLFAFTVICLLLYLFAQQVLLRKLSFFAAIVLFALVLLCNVCAWTQSNRQKQRDGAIVMSPSAVIKSTPSNSGADLFVLHEGTYVKLLDTTLNDWAEIRLTDGKQGWIEKQFIEVI